MLKFQTVIFSKSNWSHDGAVVWLRSRDLLSEQTQETEVTLQFQQCEAPDEDGAIAVREFKEGLPTGVSMVAYEFSPEPQRMEGSQDGSEKRAATLYDPDTRISTVRVFRDQPIIEGYAAVFNKLSLDLGGFQERIRPGAFTRSLEESPDVRATLEHGAVVGRTKNKTLRLREDDRGLFAEIRPADTSTGKDLVKSVRRGDLDQMSFKFRTITDDFHMEDEVVVRELIEAHLLDVAVVAFPAYEETSASVRSRVQEVGTAEAHRRQAAMRNRYRRLELEHIS